MKEIEHTGRAWREFHGQSGEARKKDSMQISAARVFGKGPQQRSMVGDEPRLRAPRAAMFC
jgi:hypothetical protein